MNQRKVLLRSLDIALTAVLLLLMAIQVTGQFWHEWLGIAMTALTIIHHVLNRKYYTSVLKGKQNALRIFQLIINTLLLFSFALTAFSGMVMSRYTTPFLNGLITTSIVRRLHLAFSHWSFVLMGMHIGLHFGIITRKLPKKSIKIALCVIMSAISVVGLWLFFKAQMPEYMFFRLSFAFLDYTKAWWLVILENLVMLLSWAFAAYLISLILKLIKRKA